MYCESGQLEVSLWIRWRRDERTRPDSILLKFRVLDHSSIRFVDWFPRTTTLCVRIQQGWLPPKQTLDLRRPDFCSGYERASPGTWCASQHDLSSLCDLHLNV